MSTNTLKTRIKNAYKTESEWSSSNPVLLKGEVAYSSDKNGMYKIGDGSSTWSALSYNKANTANSATTATSANKLATARSISLGTAVTSTATNFDGSGNITIPVNSVKEAYLSWGGKNISGNITPIGMACSNEHNANRLAFINGNALTFEYSSDGGSTWINYNYNASTKSEFCTKSVAVPIGRASGSTEYTTNSKSRITISAQSYVYTDPRKILINVSSSGGMNVLIEYKTGVSDASWQTFGTYSLSGWSGWNDIPLVLNALGGSSSQTSNTWFLRLTFSMTSVNSTYKTVAYVNSIRLFGTNDWASASYINNKGSMSSTGHLYSYDIDANATFPAKVTASSFSGSLSGNASTATALSSSAGSTTQPVYFKDGKPTATTYTLGKSVPSDAKFTDTTYSDFVKSGSGAKSGLVPAPSTTAGTTKYLREDGTWSVPPDNNTVYTHPTTSGNKHIPSGGSSGQILRWSADGTAVWGADNNTTYSDMTGATSSAAGTHGLVPAPASGKQSSFLRGDGTWAVPTDTNTWRGIQDNLTSTSTTDSLSANQGKVLKGLIDGKSDSGHTHSSYVNQNAFSNVVVGSTTVAADSATDTLTLVAGSNVTITPDATNDKITISSTDTNTHYASGTIVNNSTSATSNTSSALTNGNVYLNHIENGSVKNSHKIYGSGATTVTTDSSGNIIISSTDNNTTYTLSSITGTLAISKGGTGSTTVSGARSNLGAISFIQQSGEPEDQNVGDLWFGS